MTFREELLGCKVEELMTKDPITASPQVGVIEAFEIMLKHDIGALPVVDDEGRLIGLVTRTDLGRALLEDEYEPGTTIEEVMERDVIVVHPDDTLLDALKRMTSTPEGIYNQLPVVDDEEKLVGILTDGDILRWIAKEL
ncbi:CBS domain-containing protein [Methanopyrus sp. SNP6]|uniref:CBS domain-containing protein n=1 Tax=Methanopyrus sp. SNP6 TaxID=1937005 RepID=UPI001AEFD339|nr:CBS domain-containing protein [Methanopyrus sp. SNP6]